MNTTPSNSKSEDSLPNPTCPNCGAVIPQDAPMEECANCLLDMAGGDVLEHGEEDVLTLDWLPDYELIRQIGSGGMGVVYEAMQRSLHRKVAVKMVRPELSAPILLRRFLIEGEAAARLDHPNIVPIYEINEHEGHSYMAMKLIQGESLKEKIKKGDYRLPSQPEMTNRSTIREREKVVAQMVLALARAVHYAHEKGVFHRDIKPANILVDDQGQPHLTDFGLAKVLAGEEGRIDGESLTDKGTVLGTAEYMAPEQASGIKLTEDTELALADVYSLGVIFYELLTGNQPHKGSTIIETLRKVREEESKFPRSHNPSISIELEAIVMKSLEKDPLRRYASMQDLAEDLQNWLDGKPIRARRDTAEQRMVRWIKRNPVATALIGTLFVGMLTTGYLLTSVQAAKIQIDDQYGRLVENYEETIDQLMEDVRAITYTPNPTNVLVPGGNLATFNVREPVDEYLARYRLIVGANYDENADDIMASYDRLFEKLERKFDEHVGAPATFDLLLIKMGHDGYKMFLDGKADVMLLNAVDYIKARKQLPAIQPLLQTLDRDIQIIFTRTNSGIDRLGQISGRSVVFSDLNNSGTWLFQDRLVKHGVTFSDLTLTTNFLSNEMIYHLLPSSGPETVLPAEKNSVFAVLKGQFDVGIASERDFAKDAYHGLLAIDSIPNAPKVLVARPGLDREVVRVLSASILELSKEDWSGDLPGESRLGFGEFAAHDFAELQEAMDNVEANFFRNTSTPADK